MKQISFNSTQCDVDAIQAHVFQLNDHVKVLLFGDLYTDDLNDIFLHMCQKVVIQQGLIVNVAPQCAMLPMC